MLARTDLLDLTRIFVRTRTSIMCSQLSKSGRGGGIPCCELFRSWLNNALVLRGPCEAHPCQRTLYWPLCVWLRSGTPWAIYSPNIIRQTVTRFLGWPLRNGSTCQRDSRTHDPSGFLQKQHVHKRLLWLICYEKHQDASFHNFSPSNASSSVTHTNSLKWPWTPLWRSWLAWIWFTILGYFRGCAISNALTFFRQAPTSAFKEWSGSEHPHRSRLRTCPLTLAIFFLDVHWVSHISDSIANSWSDIAGYWNWQHKPVEGQPSRPEVEPCILFRPFRGRQAAQRTVQATRLHPGLFCGLKKTGNISICRSSLFFWSRNGTDLGLFLFMFFCHLAFI